LLPARIAKLEPRRPATIGHAVTAGLIGVVDLSLLATMCGGAIAGNGERAVLGLLGLMLMLWPTVWASWTLLRITRQRQRRTDITEREELLQARGCGDPYCPQCE
jgi:uncharacterized membrane protein YuzA (DUF378 family)